MDSGPWSRAMGGEAERRWCRGLSQEMRSKDSASRRGAASFGNAGAAAHGIEETVGRVDAVEILRYFAAENRG